MTIYNLGSINADYFYDVAELPRPGETLAARGFSVGLGGKGTNMSVAAARAAARVVHIGCVGQDGGWTVDRLTEYGVDTRHIARSDHTGHAIIMVDQQGENAIVIYPGGNAAITEAQIGAALSEAETGDIFLTQNETSGQLLGAKMARDLGLRVAYAAAPFDAEAVKAVLQYLDFLILNEVEAAQLHDQVGRTPQDLGVRDVIVTLGAKGCRWFDGATRTVQDFDAIKVDPVDTTGAGDTFTGYVLAGLDRGMPMAQAIALATKAAAIMVTRHGTADVIPDLKDIQDLYGV